MFVAEMKMDIAQIMIILLGGVAIWLVGRLEHWQRWGYIAGFLSQPFWFWTAIQHDQWGIFCLSVWYTYAWSMGIWNYWIKRDNG